MERQMGSAAKGLSHNFFQRSRLVSVQQNEPSTSPSSMTPVALFLPLWCEQDVENWASRGDGTLGTKIFRSHHGYAGWGSRSSQSCVGGSGCHAR